MIDCEPGFVESVDADRGVPDRRETGLQADGVVFLDLQGIHLAQAGGDQITVVAVTEGTQGHHMVGHGREDRPEPARGAAMLDRPPFGQAQGILAERFERVPLEELQISIDDEKKVVPGKRFRVTRQAEIGVLAAAVPEFVQLATRWEILDRLLGADDRERHEDRT